jgi:hypothetical protein
MVKRKKIIIVVGLVGLVLLIAVLISAISIALIHQHLQLHQQLHPPARKPTHPPARPPTHEILPYLCDGQHKYMCNRWSVSFDVTTKVVTTSVCNDVTSKFY